MTTALTEIPITSLPSGDSAAREFHWSSELFYRAVEAGVFDEPNQLELIQGRIIRKMPQSPLHRACRVRASRVLRSALEPTFEVIAECPVHLAFDNEPVPDIVVLSPNAANDPLQHPDSASVILMVEISISSAVYDLDYKAKLYAQAGIVEYWVVLPEMGEVVVHREPTLEGYQEVQRLSSEDAISPLAAPGVLLTVSALFGRVLGKEETRE